MMLLCMRLLAHGVAQPQETAQLLLDAVAH